jgi:hypothetical protein
MNSEIDTFKTMKGWLGQDAAGGPVNIPPHLSAKFKAESAANVPAENIMTQQFLVAV